MLMDMHIHTHFSPCSVIDILQLLRKAREVGLDGICITDHDTMASTSVFENIADDLGLCVIVGMEYTTTKGDFLIFGPIEHIQAKMDAEYLLRWIQKEGGIAIPAHPFRKHRPADPGVLQSSKIIEGLNGRNCPSENELSRNWAQKQGNGIKETGGSDAHTIEEVGRMVTMFEKDIYNVEGLIKELHYGKYSPLQGHPGF